MTAKWGLFLCNCRKTLPLDLQKLVLPVGPSILFNATDPDHDVGEFAAAIKHEQPDRVLIGCCAEPDFFSKALDPAQRQSPKLHFVNLKERCFSVHSDPTQAHAKATRLLRAAVATAEVEEAPAFNPLKVGTRLLTATDSPLGQKLAEQLGDIAQPLFVVPRGAFDPALPGEVYEGKIVEIKGRLGEFRVAVEDSGSLASPRRELKADQVVIISQGDGLFFKSRTGLHLLINPGEAEVDRVAGRVRELVGAFLKPVHVAYNVDICAGGTANQEACGICITACPYDAIGRDPENHLRMLVDHMACEGCGACVSACPTSSLRFTEPSPQGIYTRLAALLAPQPSSDGERLTVLFHCGEQGRRVLEEAARQLLQYPAGVLPVQVPCLRYVSEANMLAAFRLGADGVELLGCEQCPHGERELLHQKIEFCRVTLDAFGLGAERLRLVTAADGSEGEALANLTRFAESLKPTPIHWDGKPTRHSGNRETIEETLRSFIDQIGREPGRRPLDPSYPFAFADVEASGCTMCRSCVNVCPVHAFKLDEKAQSLQFKHIDCVACGLCEKVCPEHVITLRHEIYLDKSAVDYQTVVEDSMVSCAKCGKPYINRKALETVEARVFSLESLLDTFSGNRRNLLRMCPDCRAVDAMLEVEKGWKP